jgi:hypothetical protein
MIRVAFPVDNLSDEDVSADRGELGSRTVKLKLLLEMPMDILNFIADTGHAQYWQEGELAGRESNRVQIPSDHI